MSLEELKKFIEEYTKGQFKITGEQLRIAEWHLSDTFDMKDCDDAECIYCGILICPYSEPLHFHHDGCPACYQDEL